MATPYAVSARGLATCPRTRWPEQAPMRSAAPLLCCQLASTPQAFFCGSRAAANRAAGQWPRTAAAPPTAEGASTSERPAAGRGAASRKTGGGAGGRGRRRKGGEAEVDEGVEEDVEIFNLETGWTVEALKEGLGKWNLSALDEGAGEERNDDASDSESDSEATSWSTTNFVAGDEIEDDSHLWSAEAMVEGDADWGRHLEEDDEINDDGVETVKAAAKRALLRSIPDHVMKQLDAHAAEAKLEAEQLKPNALRANAKNHKTHSRLRILAGSAAGRRLKSAQGDQTRPMMEMVRGAVFSMIQSQLGCGNCLPEGTRWLDLFAGTGAIGIEAVSRGCSEAHFVELDPWVCRSILEPNLEAAEVDAQATVHTMKAEQFLKTARLGGGIGGGAFDFISVCPPYLLVDYNELYDLLEASPLVSETTIILVEYPKRLAGLVRDSVGPLQKIKDRKYGRTMLAIYGPAAYVD